MSSDLFFFLQSRGRLDPFPLNSPPLPMQSAAVTIRHSAIRPCKSARPKPAAAGGYDRRYQLHRPSCHDLLLRLTVLFRGAAVRGSSLLGPSLGMEASTSWAKLGHRPNPRTATSATWDPTVKLKPNRAQTFQGTTQSCNFGSFLGFY